MKYSNNTKINHMKTSNTTNFNSFNNLNAAKEWKNLLNDNFRSNILSSTTSTITSSSSSTSLLLSSNYDNNNFQINLNKIENGLQSIEPDKQIEAAKILRHLLSSERDLLIQQVS